MATAPLVSDADASPRVAAVYADIRATRGSDVVNDFWRALANDPALLEATWGRLRQVMVEGRADGLEPKVKEMLYLAVSIANGCAYCIHSHTAGAKAKGMTEAEHADLLAVVAMASQTNALANALGVAVDAAFDVDRAGGASDGASDGASGGAP